MRINRVKAIQVSRRVIEVPSTKESPLIMRVIALMNVVGLIPKGGAFAKDQKETGECNPNSESWPKRFPKRMIVTWFLLHYYTVHTIASSIIYAMDKQDMAETFCNASIVARCVVNSVILNLYLRKSDLVLGCFNSILSFDRVAKLFAEIGAKDTVSSCIKSSDRTSKVLLGIVAFVLVFFVIGCGIYASYLDVEDYISMYVYNLRALKEDVHEIVGRIFCFSEMMFSVYVVLVSYCMQTFLLVSVATLSLKLNRYQEFSSDYFSSDKYAEIGQCHTELFRLVRSLDEVIGLPYVLWIIEWMSNIAFNIPTLVTEGADGEFYELCYWYIDIGLPLVMSFIVSLAISSLYSAHSDLVYSAHRAVCQVNNSLAINNQRIGTYMIIKMFSAKIQITIFRCFAVNKTFILSLYLTITTYIVFMTQELQKTLTVNVNVTDIVSAQP